MGRYHEEHDHRTQRLRPKHPHHPRRCQGDLQNRLGNLTKESAGPRRGPRCLHLPEPKLERALAKPVAGSADEHALLRVEEGVEDGDVLPPHKAGGAGYPVHGRPERVE